MSEFFLFIYFLAKRGARLLLNTETQVHFDSGIMMKIKKICPPLCVGVL